MDSERDDDNKGAKKRVVKIGMIAIFILPFVVIALFITIAYFRKAPTSGPARVYTNHTIQPVDVLHNDSVRSTIIKPPPAKPILTNQTLPGQNDSAKEVLIKFTTNDTCKLRIRNRTLGEVMNWNLSPDDKGVLYLKPGKYSIVATNAISGVKTKKYYFDIKPGDTRGTQYLHFKF